MKHPFSIFIYILFIVLFVACQKEQITTPNRSGNSNLISKVVILDSANQYFTQWEFEFDDNANLKVFKNPSANPPYTILNQIELDSFFRDASGKTIRNKISYIDTISQTRSITSSNRIATYLTNTNKVDYVTSVNVLAYRNAPTKINYDSAKFTYGADGYVSDVFNYFKDSIVNPYVLVNKFQYTYDTYGNLISQTEVNYFGSNGTTVFLTRNYTNTQFDNTKKYFHDLPFLDAWFLTRINPDHCDYYKSMFKKIDDVTTSASRTDANRYDCITAYNANNRPDSILFNNRSNGSQFQKMKFYYQ
jgi:hypothetical protein